MGCVQSRRKKSKATSTGKHAGTDRTSDVSKTDTSTSSVYELTAASSTDTSTPPIVFPFDFGPVHRQNFCFKPKFMKYIAKNPSTPELYQNMIASCKYFFDKYPVILLPSLTVFENKWRTCFGNGVVHLNMAEISSFARIWLCYELLHDDDDCLCDGIYRLRDENNNETAELSIPNFHRFDGPIRFSDQTLTFDQLLRFADAKKLGFARTIITHEDGSMVQLEEIVANFLNLEGISFTVNPDATNISTETVKELVEIPHFLNFKCLAMHEVGDNFDIETFYEYLKKTDDFECDMDFRHFISNEYLARLEIIVDDLIATPKPLSFLFPLLDIPRLEQSKKDELMIAFHNNVTLREDDSSQSL